MKEDLKLREAVYRKMGWCVVYSHTSEDIDMYYWAKDGKRLNDIVFYLEDAGDEVVLPPIEKTWELTAKYLVPFMRGKGWHLSYQYKVIPPAIIGGKHQAEYKTDYQKAFVMWESEKEVDWAMQPLQHSKWVKDDNIAEAACKAFLEVQLLDETPEGS